MKCVFFLFSLIRVATNAWIAQAEQPHRNSETNPFFGLTVTLPPPLVHIAKSSCKSMPKLLAICILISRCLIRAPWVVGP